MKANQWLCGNCCSVNSTKYDKCYSCGLDRKIAEELGTLKKENADLKREAQQIYNDGKRGAEL